MSNGVGLPDWVIVAAPAGFLLAAAIALTSALLGGRFRHLSSVVMMMSALIALGVGVNELLTRETVTLRGWQIADGLPIGFRFDSLAAFFTVVIAIPAIAAGLFGIGYLDGHHGNRAGVDYAVALFLAAMAGLVLADGVVGFLFVWEAMSLVSFFLVMGDGANVERRRAAVTYVVMTHVATAFIVIAFLTLSRNAASFDFASMQSAAASLSSFEQNLVFVCALIGFGTKAGLIPLHIWLPKAHPAAPGHVSALMSGVMVKMAIYGLIRVTFQLTGSPSRWWGIALVIAGCVSALLGILYALMERDMKRGLAFSTVEHVGILVVGLGLATALEASGNHAAGFALFAMLLHLLNHAVFKSLLFLGASAVQHATGSRDLERLGGLIRRMPRTASAVLIGAISIAALPPLSGFASEWLLFQSLFRFGSERDATWWVTVTALAAGTLALTGALAVAAMVRFFGVGFLAQAKTNEARNANEVPATMRLAMGILAVLSIGLGLGAVWVLRLIAPAVEALTGPAQTPRLLGVQSIEQSRLDASYAPIALICLLLIVGVLPWMIARGLFGKVHRRIAPAWVCGFRLETGMQYTATAFSKALRLIFAGVIRPDRTIAVEHQQSPFVVSSIRYEETVKPVYERRLFEPGVAALLTASRWVRTLQNGSIRAYLAYLLVTLIVVIVLAR